MSRLDGELDPKTAVIGSLVHKARLLAGDENVRMTSLLGAMNPALLSGR